MLAIALALGASICWGSGDFLGGLTTRRASLWAVIVGSQAVGLVGATLVVVLAGHGWPGLHAVWPVLLGGLASVVAISCFYKALAIGSMSIVAPISATNALIPFLVGLATGERPSAAQLAGVALAAAIVLALTAAVAMGLVLVGYDATARYDALWAMLGGRISSVVVFALVFLVLRPRLEMRRSALPFIVAVGLLDTGANGLFALATTQGYLSLVSVLGAVYPVVTVLLAYGLLRERIAPHQMVGAVGPLAGIALYARAAADPDLAWACTGAGRMMRSPTVFEDVGKTVCTTNCAWSATERMVGALVEHLGEPAPGAPPGSSAGRAFPAAERMAEAEEGFYREVARAGYRGPRLRALALAVAAGELDLEALLVTPPAELPDDETERRLLELPGVGPYAAAHVMMLVGRHSRLILDSWTRPKYARLMGKPPGKLVADRTIGRRFGAYGAHAGR